MSARFERKYNRNYSRDTKAISKVMKPAIEDCYAKTNSATLAQLNDNYYDLINRPIVNQVYWPVLNNIRTK